MGQPSCSRRLKSTRAEWRTTFNPTFPNGKSPEAYIGRVVRAVRSVPNVTCCTTAFTRMPGSLGIVRSYPNAINPSRTEVQQGRLAPQNLEIAIRSLYHDGLVVINDVIPHNMLDRLNEKMVKDAHTLYARKENSPFNYNPNNLQQDAPPIREHFESQIFLSEC